MSKQTKEEEQEGARERSDTNEARWIVSHTQSLERAGGFDGGVAANHEDLIVYDSSGGTGASRAQRRENLPLKILWLEE